MRSVRGSAKAWSILNSKKRKPVSSKMKCYQKRKTNLSLLGYSSYQEYLKSEDWDKIRNRKLVKYPNCLLCGDIATQVHHMDYGCETLLGYRDYRLVQLCQSCHKRVEFDGDRKRNLRQANKVLCEMAQNCDRGKRWLIWKDHQRDLSNRARKLRNRKKRNQ